MPLNARRGSTPTRPRALTPPRSERVKACVRLRPLLGRELASPATDICCKVTSRQTLQYFRTNTPQSNHASNSKEFVYDHVFDINVSQMDIFATVGAPIIERAFEGYNGCLFAYGQTGSGKTYTMSGTPDCPGIIPLLCEALFDRAAHEECAVTVSYVEVYNESVRDLIARSRATASAPSSSATPSSAAVTPSPISPIGLTASTLTSPPLSSTPSQGGSGFNLTVVEDPHYGPRVRGAVELDVTSADEALRLLLEGNALRETASTQYNATSSRSHAVFTLTLKSRHAASAATHAKVVLVDLAGSEKGVGQQGDVLREQSSNINKSLLYLGQLVDTLAQAAGTVKHPSATGSTVSTDGSTGGGGGLSSAATHPRRDLPSNPSRRPHVNYRNSLLTRLLKDCLGGNSCTYLCATVSPSRMCSGETFNTLEFAQKALRVQNVAVKNVCMADRNVADAEVRLQALKDACEKASEAERRRLEGALADGARELERLTAERDVEQKQWALMRQQSEGERRTLVAEIGAARNRIAELDKLHDELAAKAAKSGQLQRELASREAALGELADRHNDVTAAHSVAQSEVERLRGEVVSLKDDCNALRSQLSVERLSATRRAEADEAAHGEVEMLRRRLASLETTHQQAVDAAAAAEAKFAERSRAAEEEAAVLHEQLSSAHDAAAVAAAQLERVSAQLASVTADVAGERVRTQDEASRSAAELLSAKESAASAKAECERLRDLAAKRARESDEVAEESRKVRADLIRLEGSLEMLRAAKEADDEAAAAATAASAARQKELQRKLEVSEEEVRRLTIELRDAHAAAGRMESELSDAKAAVANAVSAQDEARDSRVRELMGERDAALAERDNALRDAEEARHQVASLQRQVDDATTTATAQEASIAELRRQLEVAVAVSQSAEDAAKSSRGELQSKLEKSAAEAAEAVAERRSLEAVVEALRAEVGVLERSRRESEVSADGLRDQVRSLEADLVLEKERVSASEKQRSTLEDEVGALKGRLEGVECAAHDVQSSHETLTGEVKQLRQQLEKTKDEAKGLQQQLQEAEAAKAKVGGELASRTEEVEQFRKKAKASAESETAMATELSGLKARHAARERELDASTERVAGLERRVVDAEGQIVHVEKKARIAVEQHDREVAALKAAAADAAAQHMAAMRKAEERHAAAIERLHEKASAVAEKAETERWEAVKAARVAREDEFQATLAGIQRQHAETVARLNETAVDAQCSVKSAQRRCEQADERAEELSKRVTELKGQLADKDDALRAAVAEQKALQERVERLQVGAKSTAGELQEEVDTLRLKLREATRAADDAALTHSRALAEREEAMRKAEDAARKAEQEAKEALVATEGAQREVEDARAEQEEAAKVAAAVEAELRSTIANMKEQLVAMAESHLTKEQAAVQLEEAMMRAEKAEGEAEERAAEVVQLTMSLGEATETVKSLKGRVEEVERCIADDEAAHRVKVDAAAEELARLQEVLAGMQSEKEKATLECAQQAAELERVNRKVGDLETAMRDVENSMATKGAVDAERVARATAEAARQVAEAEGERLAAEMENVRVEMRMHEARTMQLEATTQRLRESLVAAEEEVASLADQVTAAEGAKAVAELSLSTELARTKQLGEEVASLESRCEQMMDALRRSQEALAEARAGAREAEGKVESLSEALAAREKECRHLHQEYARTHASIATLTDDRDRAHAWLRAAVEEFNRKLDEMSRDTKAWHRITAALDAFALRLDNVAVGHPFSVPEGATVEDFLEARPHPPSPGRGSREDRKSFFRKSRSSTSGAVGPAGAAVATVAASPELRHEAADRLWKAALDARAAAVGDMATLTRAVLQSIGQPDIEALREENQRLRDELADTRVKARQSTS